MYAAVPLASPLRQPRVARAFVVAISDPAAHRCADHLRSSRRSRLGCGPCVHDGARLVVAAVGPATAGPLVSRPARARVGMALRRCVPLGRADRHDDLDTGQHDRDLRDRPVARRQCRAEGNARAGGRTDDRRAAFCAAGRGDGQGYRHRAAVLAHAQRVRQCPRRVRLRRTGRGRVQLVRVGALRAAEFRPVRRCPVRIPARRPLRLARSRRARDVLWHIRRIARSRARHAQQAGPLQRTAGGPRRGRDSRTRGTTRCRSCSPLRRPGLARHLRPRASRRRTSVCSRP